VLTITELFMYLTLVALKEVAPQLIGFIPLNINSFNRKTYSDSGTVTATEVT
jgi:hypothetical protein